jgi:hypothetical protein
MLLKYNSKLDLVEKERTKRLIDFHIDERKFQDILFRSLDRLFPDDELIMLMQSRRWREEPDLMAIDKNANLYIFELKAWESIQENILQVLRYGQLYGDADLERINLWFNKFHGSEASLRKVFEDKFNKKLSIDNCNQKQVFIVMTNGMDFKTRESIKYWRSCGLDIRPWIYRVYAGDADCMNVEITPFRVDDNPYEDIAEGYYILNTNYNNNEEDHIDMLNNKKCAAYFEPWKYKIERLNKGDVIFLYQSGVGIVAFGEATGKLCLADYHGNPKHKNEEYFMKLNNFNIVKKPLSAAKIKSITDVDYRFMSTMFGVDLDSGKKIRHELEMRK